MQLREECEVKSRGAAKSKTKTHFVNEVLIDPKFEQKPANFIIKNQSSAHTRALIMGPFHMLQCENNFSMCLNCNIIDN